MFILWFVLWQVACDVCIVQSNYVNMHCSNQCVLKISNKMCVCVCVSYKLQRNCSAYISVWGGEDVKELLCLRVSAVLQVIGQRVGESEGIGALGLSR